MLDCKTLQSGILNYFADLTHTLIAEPFMNMSVETLAGGIKKIDLIGRMDILGSQEIQLKLVTEAASEKAFVILDLSNVDFMASIGIGVLVSIASTLKGRNGKLVALNPQPVFALVLERTVQSIIPIYESFEDAKKALFNSPPQT